ncbi:MAG TPA: Hansenula MRAKII killer toxin-resistant protein 1 [Actinoplanes sp.]|jgi:hypothetical protein
MAAPPSHNPGWTAHGAAAAAAAVTGAAQLGLGYGLGVVAWPTGPTADDSVWLGSLGWATWIAASATVFGAVLAARLPYRSGGPWRLTLAASAAVGALLPLALIALPARAAVRSDTFAPATIAAGYAAAGILLGAVIAYWAVVSRPVAANLIATAIWLWSLAAAAVVVELASHRFSETYLTSWQFADPGGVARYGTIHWPSALLTLAAALIIGILTAWPAVRRGDLGLGAAASGAAGPLLVAASFFVLAPRLTNTLGTLGSAYLIAPYAVLAGLAGSAMSVALGRRLAEAEAGRQDWSVLAGTAESPIAAGVAAVPASGPDRSRGRDAIPKQDGTAPARRRSTVAPPPASPPVAVINPPRATEPEPTAPATAPASRIAEREPTGPRTAEQEPATTPTAEPDPAATPAAEADRTPAEADRIPAEAGRPAARKRAAAKTRTAKSATAGTDQP